MGLIMSLQKNFQGEKQHDVNNERRWSVCKHDAESVLCLEKYDVWIVPTEGKDVFIQ